MGRDRPGGMERGRSGGESRTALDAVCRHRRIGEQPVSQHGCWSRDGGATWAATTLTAAADNVAVDATNPQIVYASAGGILVSSDSGATWRTSLPVRQSVQTIATVPGNPRLGFRGRHSRPEHLCDEMEWRREADDLLHLPGRELL